jgi:putative ABC transport system permease protein
MLKHLVDAVRLHRRRPAFAVVCVLAIGLAIAINVTVFAALDAVRTPDVPIDDPTSLVAPAFFSGVRSPSAPRLYAEGLMAAPSFAAVTSFTWDGTRILAESGRNVRDVYALSVADNYFSVLRARLDAGRPLGPGDADLGTSVAVISSVVEQTLFPGGESGVGKTIKLAGQPVRIVGVLSRRAAYPEFADVWQLGLPSPTAGTFYLARLHPGTVLSQARNESDAIRTRVDPPGTLPRNESRAEIPLAFPPSKGLNAFHWALLSAAVAVLLVACFNVANLQFARGFERANELAIRTAVGATQRQLLAHLLAEILVLGLMGGLLGLLLGAWGVKIFGSSIPILGARGLVEPQWTWRVFLGTALATFLSLFISGVVSGLTLTKLRFSNAFRSGASAAIDRQERRASSYLLAAQIGLSLALCVHSSLLAKVAIKLEHLDIGFETAHLVTGQVTLRTGPVSPSETRARYASVLADRLKGLPDVTSASAVILSSFATDDAITADYAEGSRREFPVPRWTYRVVTPDYFRTLGVRVLKGRDFHPGGENVPVAIINERAAREWWSGAEPIERMVKLGGESSNAEWVRVIGVVPDIRLSPSVEEEPPPLLMVSQTSYTKGVDRSGFVTLGFIARTSGSAANLAVAVRQMGEGSEAGPAGRTWASNWERARNIDTLKARQRFVTTLFWTFAGLAVILALVGVYSLTTYTVSRRRMELGVRLALGASPQDLIREQLRQANLVGMFGIALGLLFAYWSIELLDAFLLGLEPFDPIVFGVAAVLVLLVVLGAALPSALRSGSVDPQEALRST